MADIQSRLAASTERREPLIGELLQLHDEGFVRAVYERVLGRSPGAAEIGPWLTSLRGGSVSKMDALIAIRYSAEGRERRVRIKGLAIHRLARAIDRVPLIGYGARWIRHLVLLPRLVHRINAIEAYSAASLIEERGLTARALADFAAELRLIDAAKVDRPQVEQSIARLEDSVRRIGETKADGEYVQRTIAELAKGIRRIDDAKADGEYLEAALAQLRDDLRRIDESKANLDAFADAATRLESLRADTTAVEDVLRRWGLLPLSPTAGGSTGSLEAFYRRFEDRFRGTREDIRARLSFYVPILRTVAGVSSARMPTRFVDLGCGRGEMLEALRECGLSAYGVDQNGAMVTLCREMGLDVVQADALAHLESLPSDSCAGILSIHMVEHLPFRAVLMLFDEAFRVLRPGGIAIFETPNPENLIVGACNFHYDPTHVRPLPPEPTRFALESVGFERVAIERLHPGATSAEVDGAEDKVARLYLTLMLVPQDYALIAYKPTAHAAQSGAEGS